MLLLIKFSFFNHFAVTSELDQFGDTILFTTDDDILEAMSRYDETFLGESEGPESLVAEEELQRPRTADGEGEERPFTQAGFREEDLKVSTGLFSSGNRFSECFFIYFFNVKRQSYLGILFPTVTVMTKQRPRTFKPSVQQKK